mmetsp:Transcript_119306/g.210943  ORF Transcript_119306/g.210943 Transcript_119306/m.210943 type:complete len:477 (-) Transcript_119306:45-1475(-)
MPLYEGPADEAPRMLKDGQIAIANTAGGLPSGSALAREAQLQTTRLAASWRAGPPSARSPLYRSPILPVYAGPLPGGQMVSVHKYKDDTRDWRKLHPHDIMFHFADLEATLRPVPVLDAPRGQKSSDVGSRPQIEGLIAAVAVGILQACNEHMYWSPCFGDVEAIMHDDLRLPMSRLVPASGVPDISVLEPHEHQAQVNIRADVSPLAECQMLAAGPAQLRVALVRFTAAGDKRSLIPSLNEHREAQLFLQTTYLQALHEMQRHLHAEPVQALDSGGVICTHDVSIVRGPLEGGAVWLDQAPLIDVLWVSLQRNPRQDDQGQYARIDEKARVVETIDRVFRCAAANGVDALVFPQLDVCGGNHPAADAGDLLRKAILEYGRLIKRVSVCQEYVGQLHDNWPVFAAALESGRKPIEHRELVPLSASPYLRPGWMEKKKRPPSFRSTLASSSSRSGNCASSQQTSKAVLESAGRAIAC